MKKQIKKYSISESKEWVSLLKELIGLIKAIFF